MIRREDVKRKVVEFIKREFPEIGVDVEEAQLSDEIADILFDMLTGEDDE